MSVPPERPRLVAPVPIGDVMARIEARLAAGEIGLPPCETHGVDDCVACREQAEAVALAAAEERWLARSRAEALAGCGVPERYRSDFPRWAKDLPGEGWTGDPWAVVIVGKPGSGKTHHAAEMLWRWLRPRHSRGLFIRAAKIPFLAYADKDHPQDRALYERLLSDPVVAIDDLGRGYRGAAVQAVGEVCAERYDRLLPTVFTTNATTESYLGDPALADRLRDAVTVEFQGDSRRGPK